MPANTITYQPASAQLLAAYRPIVLKVEATSTDGDPVPPFVACDIYIADVYYKSILRTAPESFTNLLSVFSFDISDALQEYLAPDLAAIDNSNLLVAPHMSAKVFCKFRSSEIDDDGFTVEEPTKPVQGTKFTDPVSGTGLQSNSFFVINSALQHEDNQNLASHLNAFKTGTWHADAFPLSHRSRYFFCNNDSDHFPVIFRGDCITADIILNYRLRGSSSFLQATATDTNVCDPIDYSILVTANQVDITLDEALEAGHLVLVQYKKQADSTWIDAGQFTTQNFSFNINGSDIAGDYDIRVIHFCSACLSADPVTDTFTLSGTVANLDWRGIDPFCVQQTLGSTVYIVLEERNAVVEEEYFPNDTIKLSKSVTTTVDLYAKFYSDAAHLTPVSVVQAGLKVYVKQHQHDLETQGSSTYQRDIQQMLSYTVNANGVEVLLGSVITDFDNYSYSPFPTVSSSIESDYSFTPYPTHLLTGGNTGNRGYLNLEEYNTDTDLATGVTKDNDSGDPDYIAPVSDMLTCPAGPPQTNVSYGYGLDVGKVEFIFNSTSTFAPTVGNTESGGWIYLLPIDRNTDVNVTVKVRTLDGGNSSGIIKVRVAYVDSGGVSQTVTFNVPNNIETTLAQTFQNITNVNISNY